MNWEVVENTGGSANLDAIRAVPTPMRTATWQPVAHMDFLEVMGDVLEKKNLPIARAQYDLSSGSTKNLFGTWDFDMQGERVFSLGFRNSHNKQFALGLAAGNRVIACSNMMFSGELVEFRKHTSKIYLELRVFIENAVDQITDGMERLAEWHDSLHEFDLSDNRAKLLTFKGLEQEVVPPSKFHEFYELYFMAQEQEESLYVDRNLQSWHGATTELYGRHRSLVGFNSHHKKLNTFVVEAYAEVIQETRTKLVRRT